MFFFYPIHNTTFYIFVTDACKCVFCVCLIFCCCMYKCFCFNIFLYAIFWCLICGNFYYIFNRVYHFIDKINIFLNIYGGFVLTQLNQNERRTVFIYIFLIVNIFLFTFLLDKKYLK